MGTLIWPRALKMSLNLMSGAELTLSSASRQSVALTKLAQNSAHKNISEKRIKMLLFFVLFLSNGSLVFGKTILSTNS